MIRTQSLHSRSAVRASQSPGGLVARCVILDVVYSMWDAIPRLFHPTTLTCMPKIISPKLQFGSRLSDYLNESGSFYYEFTASSYAMV